MKKIVSSIFAVMLCLAVLHVSADDKRSKKVKVNNKIKVANQVNRVLQAVAPDGKVQYFKAITIADLQKLKQKPAKK